MQSRVRSMWVVLMATLALASACNNSSMKNGESSNLKSDWLTETSPGGLRTYAIDWSCEPKQYGSASETKANYQDEYCEWKIVKQTATEKTCKFTTSFDKTRDFYLNSRGKTPVNSIPAARQLVRDCNSIALSRLKKGQTPGNLCSGITSGCVSGRNSDPEICDKVRWAVGEKYKGNIEFCVDQLSQSDFISTPRPLMQFGILANIPENCEFADEEHTELLCTIPSDETCFSIAGQIRVGLHVVTKVEVVETPSTAEVATEELNNGTTTDEDLGNDEVTDGSGVVIEENLPSSRECFVP